HRGPVERSVRDLNQPGGGIRTIGAGAKGVKDGFASSGSRGVVAAAAASRQYRRQTAGNGKSSRIFHCFTKEESTACQGTRHKVVPTTTVTMVMVYSGETSVYSRVGAVRAGTGRYGPRTAHGRRGALRAVLGAGNVEHAPDIAAALRIL